MTRERAEADDLVEEVQRVKREISAEFDHDPAKLIAFLTEYQKQFADRLAEPRWRTAEENPPPDPPALRPLAPQW